MTAHASFRTADGLTLAYSDIGKGPALLCLAGLTRNMDDFEPVLAQFADRARIIRLDSRGRGLSDHDPDWTHYTVPQEAADALALLDHLELPKTAILGTSRGGLIALGLAAMARERLTGVIFNDIGPKIDGSGIANIGTYIGRRPAFSSYADAADKLPTQMPFIDDMSRDDWMIYARRSWDEAEDGLRLRYDPALGKAFDAQAASSTEGDAWPMFDMLDGLPLALLRGAHSNILSAETAAEMRRRRPDMAYVELPNRGHVPFLDEAPSRALIADFLERLK